MATVKFKKLDPRAIIPTRATDRSSGLDLYALEDFSVFPSGQVTPVRTGIGVQLPDSHEGQVRPRSGLARNYNITVLNSPGTIDEDYRGEIIVLLATNDNELSYCGKAGDRIAQLVVKKVEYHEVVEIEEFDGPATARGTSGFGSSGR